MTRGQSRVADELELGESSKSKSSDMITLLEQDSSID